MMMEICKKALTIVMITFFVGTLNAQYVLKSPDGRLKVDVVTDKAVSYTVTHDSDLVLASSPISMSLVDGTRWGIDSKVIKSSTRSVDQRIASPIYKRAEIEDSFNELTLRFAGNYSIRFRAYDSGVAYRVESHLKKPFIVENEQAEFNFPSNSRAYVPYVVESSGETFAEQLYNSFENTYEVISLKDWDASRLAFLPLVVESVGDKKVAITEADLLNYPGMFLSNQSKTQTLKGVFAPYPREITIGGHNMLQGEVRSVEGYIAKCEGATLFPWRIIVVAENDAQLADNDMVYQLASPCELSDISWIKPGKVMWDWWNDWNLYGVDFRSGINNETYKYYIDQAATHGIEYIILDEGWSVIMEADLMNIVPEIDLPMLVKYGKQRGVGIILWAGYHALNRDIEGICKHYSEMGIKGFKIDFMDRDDQPMVDFHYKTAAIAAKYRLLIDYHGTYKPTGLQRTFPNVINFEGVFGLENMKWNSTTDQVIYDVIAPFVRMIAGPMDYTQGAMRNATMENYRSISSEPMSQGTRCRQMAQYVVFESPLNMMCDSPSNYNNEPECTKFIASIPTVWDDTRALQGRIGEHISIARLSGGVWYVGGMTDHSARSVTLDISFIGEGNFAVELFKDGVNADRAARDYKRQILDLPNDRKLTIDMAPAGGYAMKIYQR